MTTDSKEVAMGAQQGAAGQAADHDEWRHVREVLARRTPGSTLMVNRYGAYVMAPVAGKLRDTTVLHITRTDDQDQTERDLDALSVLWNTADALLSALARERRRTVALEEEVATLRALAEEPPIPIGDGTYETAVRLAAAHGATFGQVVAIAAHYGLGVFEGEPETAEHVIAACAVAVDAPGQTGGEGTNDDH